jgi:hypothetical protein
MPQRFRPGRDPLHAAVETGRLHGSSRKSDSLRRLTLLRRVPVTAKPNRPDARPRRSEYNVSWAGLRCTSDGLRAATGEVRGGSASCDHASDIYIGDRESYQLPGSNHDACRCDCNGHSLDDIARCVGYDGGPRVTSGDLASTARPYRGTTDRGRPTSYSSISTIVPVRITMFVCGAPRALRQVVRQ